ncbi:hypothetical protein [Streptomyces sp. NPDC001828]|uniref:hypothetical protein n=1 Tax=Streptomyces sp. NPDC001828 TaxID=3364615 RepID=UPI0036770C4D
MRRTEAKIPQPDLATGSKYRQRIQSGADGTLCSSGRMWIAPGKVEVRDDGGSLYILKASLDVKAKSDHINDPHSQSCTTDPATGARNEGLERTLEKNIRRLTSGHGALLALLLADAVSVGVGPGRAVGRGTGQRRRKEHRSRHYGQGGGRGPHETQT